MPEYKTTADAISALSAEQYRVTQENGTEPPGTGVTEVTVTKYDARVSRTWRVALRQ